MERGLELWKDGTNAAGQSAANTADGAGLKKVRCSKEHEFGNERWGQATKNYAVSTDQLTNAHWDIIYQEAALYSTGTGNMLQEAQ